MSSINFNLAVDNLAKKYAEENAKPNSFLNPQSINEKLKKEFKGKVELPDLTAFLTNSRIIINNQGGNYLTAEELNKLNQELDQAALQMELFDYDSELETTFAQHLGISADTLNALDQMARGQFTENVEESLSLFALLTTLEENQAEHWYGLGMCFQELNNFEKAILCYKNCIENDQVHVGSYFYLAECYSAQKSVAEARDFLEKAKKLMIDQKVEGEWQVFSDHIDFLLRREFP